MHQDNGRADPRSGGARTVTSDVIFAPATPGGGAIAIMRLSGPGCAALVEAIAGHLPSPRRATLRTFRDRSRATIDHGVVLWLPGPGNATGEDAAEFHVHGGPAVLAALSEALLDLGARPAEAGAFSRRAFLNGRLDLLEAEGIADLVAAETEEQRRQALAQTEGSLSRLVAGWTEQVRHALARCEASIDFPDEAGEHGAAALTSDQPDLRTLADALAAHLRDGARAERLRNGITIVLAGPVNVGKSTLLNRLCGRDAAIVSAEPGTTRDRIEVRTILAGVPATLVDTAGFRDSTGEIEREGMRRAARAIAEADLVLRLRTGEQDDTEVAAPGRVIDVFNKIDRIPAPEGALGISAATGDNVDTLRHLLDRAVGRIAGRADAPLMTRARHRHALAAAADALVQAGECTEPELRADALRDALRHLGSLTGAVGTEDLLDTIFSTFCIGK